MGLDSLHAERIFELDDGIRVRDRRAGAL